MTDRVLAGKTAMVTGGASGMGLAMSVAFAAAGADVAIGSLLAGNKKAEGEVTHLPGQDQLDSAQALLEAQGVGSLAMNLDVTSDDSVEAFFQATVKRFGKVDILVNAAGITAEHTIVGHSDSLWNRVIEVNLTGTYRAIKRALPGMIERKWGRIINIASTAATVGAVTSGAYCASKAGVVGLTRCVALEGAPHGVTCNAISPTWVDTGFAREWMTDIAEKQEHRTGDEYVSDVKKLNPQGRLISPTEIGALALFLCTEGAAGITMEDLRVSAGSLW
ncbi:MAG TPA: SDR family oxidoreductase [Acidimicrobiia bacterium]|nr:SDR family oxidoreductase [Acidimicrobiia bacterium]